MHAITLEKPATGLDKAVRAVLDAIRKGENLHRYGVELKLILGEAVRTLTGYLRRVAGPRAPQIAEEVAAEWVAALALNGLPNYDPMRPILPLMKASLRNMSCRRHRDEQRRAAHERNVGSHRLLAVDADLSDRPGAELLREEADEVVALALFAMSPRNRHVLDLLLSPLGQDEIAHLLKVTPGNWRGKCFRARREFVEKLRATCEELGLPLDVLPFRVRRLYAD